ncbi:MAG: AAA family ATPase [Catenulispora sp.]
MITEQRTTVRPTDNSPEPGILGRAAELRRLDELVAGAVLSASTGADAAAGPNVLVLTGEPGVGKSTLVEWAARRGRVRGLQTLRVRGSESESELCFSALHQLLRPLLPDLEGLAEHARAALLGALGMGASNVGDVDPLHLRVAVTDLLSGAAARQPLLLLVDDVQWVDRGSQDVLAFVARRLAGEPIAMLVAARGDTVPERFDRDFPQLIAEPLDRATAGMLLDAQPEPPLGRIRAQILEQAAGIPLALIELTRVVAKKRDSDFNASEPLPLTKRLENLFAADLSGFPPQTRRALLLLAAGATQWSEILRADPDLDGDQVLLPAERAGLLRVEAGHVVLHHPIVRSAIYQSASFGERRQAHLALAAGFAKEPDRHAWHLAAAALEPDEEVASALADSAERSQKRGGHAAAAAALERAAQLTPDPELRAKRLLAAAHSAMFAGYPQWVGDLAAQALGFTRDPALRAQAAFSGGWALGVTLRHDEALALLLPAAESLSADAPAEAGAALGTAATSVYNSGDPFYRTEMQRLYGPVAAAASPIDQAWTVAACWPHTRRREALEILERGLADPEAQSLPGLVGLGATAWILDQTDSGTRLLSAALDHLRRMNTAGMNATVALALALAQFESGSWADSLSNAEDAFRMAAEAGADNVTVGSRILQATIQALRGDHAAARAQALEAVRDVDLHKSRSLHARYRHALGTAAWVEGDHVAAYEQLRSAFTRDDKPGPIHYHASGYYLGDLAAAAVRAGRTDDARRVLDGMEQTLGPLRSPRVGMIWHRAAALLDDGDADAAEGHFRAALADPACAQWPFEHALIQLDYGEWLRRRRRSADARPMLATASEIFQRLGAPPWFDRAAAELRAAGAPTGAAARPGPVADLTPQEREIAELAAQGLTNRDIAARLFLSPRTVGYHLHKVFPKLGVSVRAQLRDALTPLAPAAEPPDRSV